MLTIVNDIQYNILYYNIVQLVVIKSYYNYDKNRSLLPQCAMGEYYRKLA